MRNPTVTERHTTRAWRHGQKFLAPFLGIPTVQDRIIQQVVQQTLTDKFDRGFSLHSYGYRSRYSAQQAVLMAQTVTPTPILPV
ncbi:MAG: hypothetical protein D0528_02580 [Methylococcales bacterium]|nr:MAG: hypothetical protein D0528_02580 [Methylococcales bacterium]